jgi:branched-chain amino acid transport system permease protein
LQHFIQYAVNAVSLGSFYALSALGIALIFGVMRLINFAHGQLIMVGGYALFFLVPRAPAWTWIPVVVVIVLVLALGMERLAFRPVRSASAATLLITSFAISYLIQNVAILTMTSLPRTVGIPLEVTSPVVLGGIFITKLDILTLGVTVLLVGCLTFFLHRTTLGVQMRAAAEDFRMARILGINANLVIAMAFAFSGIFGATAALVLVAQGGTVDPTFGVVPVLYAFVATILGGMGSLTGAALGGYILGILTVVLQLILPPSLAAYRDALVFFAVILFFIARPEGLIVAPWTRERV